jgi:hypothetical protein
MPCQIVVRPVPKDYITVNKARISSTVYLVSIPNATVMPVNAYTIATRKDKDNAARVEPSPD